MRGELVLAYFALWNVSLKNVRVSFSHRGRLVAVWCYLDVEDGNRDERQTLLLVVFSAPVR